MADVVEDLLRRAEGKRDELTNLVAEAVRIPSVSGEEGAIARFFRDRCSDLGLEVDAWVPDHGELKAHRAYVPVEYDYEGRQNVIGTLPGVGGGKSLYLYGHIDTVPVDPNTTWQHDPYGGDVAQGKVFGRGSADMKGGCGVALMTLKVLREAGIRLRGDLAAHLILDEEAGGNGTLSAVLRGHYGPEAGCIMLEPTTPGIMLVSNRGAQYYRITVPGNEGGTEYYRDIVSAIDAGIVIHQAVKRYAQLRESVVAHPLYELHGRNKVPTAVCRFHAGAWPSTVPGEAVLEGTIECLPGEDIHAVVDEFEGYLREVAADDPWLRVHPFRFERFGLWFEASAIEPSHEFVTTLRDASKTALGKEPTVAGGGGSDLRLPVLYADCPTVLWGPGGGPIHSVDEWVEVDQLMDMLKACLVTAVRWCGVANG
jgi:acetylornithine deacetylase